MGAKSKSHGAVLLATAAVTAAAVPLPAAVSGKGAIAVCGHRAYVTNSYADSLSVIDVETAKLVERLPTGKAPINPTFNRDWTKLYVANSQAGSLTIIDARTGKVEKTISAQGGMKPSGLRFLPDGRHLVISFLGDTTKSPGTMGIMDLSTGKLVRQFPVGAQSERFDITPDGKRAFVANLGAQAVEVVDLDAGKIIATIPIAEALPFNVLISPKGDRAYVASVRGKTISAIDTKTNRIANIIETANGPNGMAFSPDYKSIYVSVIYAGVIQKVDLASLKVAPGLPAGDRPGHIRLTPDGKRAVFVRPYGSTVDVVDVPSFKVVNTIESGMGATTVAICGNP